MELNNATSNNNYSNDSFDPTGSAIAFILDAAKAAEDEDDGISAVERLATAFQPPRVTFKRIYTIIKVGSTGKYTISVENWICPYRGV